MRTVRRVLVALVLLPCCLVVAVVCRMGCTTWALNRANPLLDMERALKREDYTFIGVDGITLAVPGLPNGADNAVVAAHGIRSLGGTDFPILPGQSEFNSAASRYTTRYNLALLYALLTRPDAKTTKVLAAIQSEMRLLEHRNARQDALHSYQSGSPTFLSLNEEGVVGVPSGVTAKLSFKGEVRDLTMSSALLEGGEKQRLARLIQRYIGPYNRRLYGLVTKRPSPPSPVS